MEGCKPVSEPSIVEELRLGGASEAAAATAVQRLFRGHRTRRNLADAAVMAHKFGWWNVLEGAILQQNSSQFYAYKSPDNATTRWLRLKTKAAKVGKGLSKDEKARKLALQHWLEAIDPRHRYGHNLHFYHDVWIKSDTQQPFFYWLDLGEGKELDLQKCSRSTLQKDLIKYLSPKEREMYEVKIAEGKLVYKLSEEPVDTPHGDKWIFVLSTCGKLYVGKKEKGKLQHSSFLAGGAATAAGRLLVKDGTIELMEAHSGHYLPTPENFSRLVKILLGNGADLTIAKVQSCSDDMLQHQTSSTTNERKEVGCDDAAGSGILLSSEMSDSVTKVSLYEQQGLRESRGNSDGSSNGGSSTKRTIEGLHLWRESDDGGSNNAGYIDLQGLHVEVVQTEVARDVSASSQKHFLFTPALIMLTRLRMKDKRTSATVCNSSEIPPV